MALGQGFHGRSGIVSDSTGRPDARKTMGALLENVPLPKSDGPKPSDQHRQSLRELRAFVHSVGVPEAHEKHLNGEMDHATWLRFWGDIQHTVKTAAKDRSSHPGGSFGQRLIDVHTKKRQAEQRKIEAEKKAKRTSKKVKR